MFKIHYFTGHFIQKRYLSLVFYDNRTLKISKSKKSEQYFRDKIEIFIRLFDEHFARHFESHWRETWRHTGRWTVPQISLETPSPLPPPPPGRSYLGEPVIEFQRYASNANYTLNLLHSIHGVDYFDVLRGPSNSMELWNFCNEALSVNRADGTTILENGDMVIMDNCGFHHGHFAEPLSREILQEHGDDLLFQPAYSPHLNACELCFHQIKCYLRQNSSLTANETEIAIGDGVSKITAANSTAYFRKCSLRSKRFQSSYCTKVRAEAIKKDGSFPSPSPVIPFFAFFPTFSTNSRGNACYAGYRKCGYIW